MLRRLRIYFTGFGIGLVMVYFMFMRDDSRDLDIWTPSQRVLEDIRNDSVFQATPRLACFQDCNEISAEQMLALWTDSEVKSLNPGGDPYRYLVELETETVHLSAELERRKRFSLLYIKDINHPNHCDCD
ncbi:MAG: hypothetical protein RLP15_06685 [Cryomorphaceae bacterium]